jgi:putative ABC transport system permease protein
MARTSPGLPPTNARAAAAPAIEGAVAVVGSLAVGVPVGIGLAMLGIRVLGLFFTLPPPLVVVPTGALLGLAGLMIAASAVAMGVTLWVVARRSATPVLREP